MIAETIFVGTELLLGNIVNTNAAYIASELAKYGIATYYQTVVGDNKERLSNVFKTAYERADLVILSGGLGPTQDDITKETVAETLGKKLHLDKNSKDRIIKYFEKRDKVMPDNNFKQAMIPEGATVLDNDNGTAPGVCIEENGKIVILLPGPPIEVKAMFSEKVVPILLEHSDRVFSSTIVKICGKSESEVADLLDDLISMSGDVTVAPYAKTCEVHVRVTASGTDEKAAKKLIKPIVKDIKLRLGDSVYTTTEEVTLEKAVVDILLDKELTISTVESCTGGLVAGRLINVPGVSEVFKSGYVTYSNKSKRKVVGVKKITLQKYGAVSHETVKEMCLGACFFGKADVSIAISGIAGPDGGTVDKPVGTVFIGCCVCGHVTTKEYHFTGNRDRVREMSVAESLILLRRCVLEYYSKVTFGKDAVEYKKKRDS